MLVRPLSTVDNTCYTRVSHSRQWSNYNITHHDVSLISSFSTYNQECHGTKRYSKQQQAPKPFTGFLRLDRMDKTLT